MCFTRFFFRGAIESNINHNDLNTAIKRDGQSY